MANQKTGDKQTALPKDGRKRVVITHVSTDIDCGRFAVKRCQGDRVYLKAHIFADGHDELQARLCFRHQDERQWQETPMRPLGNDLWEGWFNVNHPGRYQYTLIAWVDPFRSWQAYFSKKYQANQDVAIELQAGARLIEAAAERAAQQAASRLKDYARLLKHPSDLDQSARTALDPSLTELMTKHADRRLATVYPHNLYVWVDRPLANFSAWYELFPRSWSDKPDQHGTFRDVIEHLPYVADMGFDVLYLPPIHPIGHTNRKGRNNNPQAQPGDVGSPWGIGDETGGHKAIHPQLGTLQDFHDLIAAAAEYGMEIALDIALQCSPDHPYIKKHPQWFSQRPDGSLRYAENPPKKYEDIYPIYFETDDWQNLWQEIKSIFDYWIDQGVKIFRVDNPHTKPFAFWEWLISSIKRQHPEVIFLAEAFTRPQVMYHLAKLGFSQSYTYFTWRNTPAEMQTYLQELTQTQLIDYFRPNFWPNTPDILHADLQNGGRPAFIARLTLAATLSTNFGIYGPAFELAVNTPREPGSEEYLNSEKYEIKNWNLNDAHSLRPIITRINQIRRQHEALQQNSRITFHATDNSQLLCYSKSNADRSDIILVIVNFDYHHQQSGWTRLELKTLGIGDEPFTVKDLLTGAEYTWQGAYNYIELAPQRMPVHILTLNP